LPGARSISNVRKAFLVGGKTIINTAPGRRKRNRERPYRGCHGGAFEYTSGKAAGQRWEHRNVSPIAHLVAARKPRAVAAKRIRPFEPIFKADAVRASSPALAGSGRTLRVV
jgi:hypothetical protein